MAAYLVRRLVLAALLVFVVGSAALALSRVAPGDYATQTLGLGASAEAIAAARGRYGLDRPFTTQYIEWVGRAIRFDFGRSFAYDRPVAELIAERAANTALLALAALLLATALGVPLGVLSGARPARLGAAIVRTASLVILSVPPLVISLALVVFAARTGLLPAGGMRTIGRDTGGVLDVAKHMVVPVIALALPVAAFLERLQARAIGEVIGRPFVLAAIARGVPARRVIWRDGLRVALVPVVSKYGVIVGTLLSGSFAVEMVTAWPGLGRLMLDALRARDMYLVAGCAASGAAFLALGTLLSDVALAAVDPRVSE